MSRKSFAIVALLALASGKAQAASSPTTLVDSTGPPVTIPETYTLRWHSSVYNNTVEFCRDWDEECVTYLGSFSDRYRVYCDAAAPGPDVRVFCGGNTVNRPDEYFDYTSNNQRFVSASLVAGPGEDLEPASSSITAPSSTSSRSSSPISNATISSSTSVVTSSSHTTASPSSTTVPAFELNSTSTAIGSAITTSTTTSLTVGTSSANTTTISTTTSFDSLDTPSSSSSTMLSSSPTSHSTSPSIDLTTRPTSTTRISTTIVAPPAMTTLTLTSTSPLRPTATSLPSAVLAAQRAADRARRQAEAWLSKHQALAARRAREWRAKKAAWLDALERQRRKLIDDARREAERIAREVVERVTEEHKGGQRVEKKRKTKEGKRLTTTIEEKLEAKLGKQVMGWLTKYIDDKVAKDVKRELAEVSRRKKKRRQHDGHRTNPACH